MNETDSGLWASPKTLYIGWIAMKCWQSTLTPCFLNCHPTLANLSDTKFRYRKFPRLKTNPFLYLDYINKEKGFFLYTQKSIRIFLFCSYKCG